MALYPKFRDVHLWVGLILLVPLVIIGGTGVMLNHEHALGLKPGYEKKKEKEKPAPQVETSLTSIETGRDKQTADKAKHVSTLQLSANLWKTHATAIDEACAAAQAEWGEVSLERIELKDEHNYGLVVKVKAAHEAFKPEREIVWSVASHSIVMHRGDEKKGAGGIEWHKVVHDLHTGKFFSDMYGFFWSDITGIAILALSGTGVVLYLIPLSKKWGKKKQPAAARKPATAGAITSAISAKAKLAAAPAPSAAVEVAE